jgi:dephospho-CoA kinase
MSEMELGPKAMQPPLPVIAVVGGIGSGKSVVARELAKHGGHLIQADELGHEALRQPDILKRVVERWGAGVLDDDGAIMRRKLGQIVFADPAELRRLESLVYPFIGKRIEEEKLKARGRRGVRFIVIDAAVLLEAGWTSGLDRLIFVAAPLEVRLDRVRQRGWDERELARREGNQMPLEEKKRRADTVILNDGGFDKIAEQVERLLRDLGLS